jgi:hypothetical protein
MARQSFEYGRSQIKGAILYSSAAVAKPLDPSVPIIPENRPVTVVGPYNRQGLPSLTIVLGALLSFADTSGMHRSGLIFKQSDHQFAAAGNFSTSVLGIAVADVDV